MNPLAKEQLKTFLLIEAENAEQKAQLYFDKWIEQGEETYKEQELMHVGRHFECKRVLEFLDLV